MSSNAIDLIELSDSSDSSLGLETSAFIKLNPRKPSLESLPSISDDLDFMVTNKSSKVDHCGDVATKLPHFYAMSTETMPSSKDSGRNITAGSKALSVSSHSLSSVCSHGESVHQFSAALELSSDNISTSNADKTLKASHQIMLNFSSDSSLSLDRDQTLKEMGSSLDSLPTSSDEDTIAPLISRLSQNTKSSSSLFQLTSSSLTKVNSSNKHSLPSPKSKRKYEDTSRLSLVKSKTADFYSDSSDVECSQPKRVPRAESNSPCSDIISAYQLCGSLQSTMSTASQSSQQLDSQASCSSTSATLSQKEKRAKQKLDVKKQKEEEKQEKKRQKEEQKRLQEQEKQRKQALQEAARMFKPTECLKHLTVCISAELLKTSYGSATVNQLQKLGMRYEQQEQILDNIITFIRETPRVQETNSQVQCVQNETIEDTVLLVMAVEEFVKHCKAFNQAKQGVARHLRTDSLTEHIMNVGDILEGRNVTVICHGVERYLRIVKDFKKQNKNPLTDISRDEIEQALIDLQLRSGFNVRLVETDLEVAQLVQCYTKAVAEAPFKKNRLQSHFSFHSEGGASVRVDKDGVGLLKAWRQQLQQFRNVTAEVANTIVAKYPSPMSLVQAYEACSNPKEAELLLQDLEVRRGAGVLATSRRVGKELSRRVFQLLTSTDPDIVLK